MPKFPDLPILSVADQINAGLEQGHLILNAPPGSGKSTLVPLLLKDAAWLNGKKIVMLEPRRIAARACAMRMAFLLGEEVGLTVGFQTRFEKKLGATTRVEVITEGILTRRLQNDPELSGVGLIIFDEFHERNLHADLALALALDSVNGLREDLRLLVMSATLDADKLGRMLADAPVVECKGTLYPVDIAYLKAPLNKPLAQQIVGSVKHLLVSRQGDILVFLPAVALIKRVDDALSQQSLDAVVVSLYGDLSPQQQDRALLADPDGKRKVVLATDLAETSLTIEGIAIVLDSGLAKKPLFNANTGLTTLETINISKASATQRAGRAGRLQAGFCLRLWTEQSHAARKAFMPVEIVDADLSSLALELLQWGVKDPADLQWVDKPPAGHWQQAIAMLQQFKAVDGQLRLSGIGRQLIKLPVHPRLGFLMVHANNQGCFKLGVQLAALLSERDIFDRNHAYIAGADILDRLAVLESNRKQASVHQASFYRLKQSIRQFSRLLTNHSNKVSACDPAELLASVFSDRVAKRKQGRCYQLANGQYACLNENDSLLSSDYLVVCNLDAGKREGRIYSAIAVDKKCIETTLAEQIQQTEKLRWNDKIQRLEVLSQRRLAAIVLAETKSRPTDSDAIMAFWQQYVQQQGLSCLGWSESVGLLLDRVRKVNAWMPGSGWSDLSEPQLLLTLEDWLSPWLGNILSLNELQKLDYLSLFRQMIGWDKLQQLEKLLPTHFTVPSGSSKKLDYTDPDHPQLFVRLQELFGLQKTPTVCDGRVAIKIHILSPAQRPVQVTTDLQSFWKNTYLDVKKDLKGRYPKHYWPDDPYQAEAIRGVRPKR